MDPILIFGLNILGYLYQVRIFYKLLRARIALLPELDFSFTTDEREFVAQLLRAFDEAFQPNHPMLDASAASRVLIGWYRELCDLPSSMWPDIERMVLAAAKWRLEQMFIEHVELPLRHHDVSWVRAGGAWPTTIASLDGSTPPPAALEEARFLNRLLTSLDETEDMDRLFARLEDARAAIRANVVPVE
jgi:hypothetical protein